MRAQVGMGYNNGKVQSKEDYQATLAGDIFASIW